MRHRIVSSLPPESNVVARLWKVPTELAPSVSAWAARSLLARYLLDKRVGFRPSTRYVTMRYVTMRCIAAVSASSRPSVLGPPP